ncbi:MAG TPA: DNA topoisomerase IB [Xanthomonadales bacterium]|nr:DNA topoisomerase IB [Xanthomonadales bacterium]
MPAAAAPAVPAVSLEAAASAGLVWVADSAPGIRRRRAGRGFGYVGTNGRAVRDAATLRRIRALAIPPAWTDVWICPDARGHIQATGRDARGRKQYRYHVDWQATRDEGKYARLLAFGQALPRLRRRLRADLARTGLPREKVIAIVVTLLAQTLIRIGNDEYARTNRSYGLTTLRDRHVHFTRGRAFFRFRGKGGLDHEVELDDARLARLVRQCQDLPGQQLFQYVDDDGTRQPVDSALVNEYLKEAMGAEFTAKDFRTWGGTLRAIARLAAVPLPETGGERARKSCITAAIKDVARELGNTPAVCRKAYIHPEVFAAWRDGAIARYAPTASCAASRRERLALSFLRCRMRLARSAGAAPRTRRRRADAARTRRARAARSRTAA